MKIELWPPLFAFTKEFLKNTKENMPPDHFCSHLRQDGQIELPSSPDCHICIAVSENTDVAHIRRHNGHMAIWPYGHYGVK
jgi:hypothetical protein